MGAKKSWVTFIAAMSLLLTACSQESGASAAESNTGITEEVIETMEAETFRVSQEISLPGASGGERTGEPVTVRFAGDFCLAEGFAITEALDRRGGHPGMLFRRSPKTNVRRGSLYAEQ